MGVQTSLDAIAAAPSVIEALRLADELAFESARDGGPRTIRLLTAALTGDDQLLAIAATHALGQVFDQQADVVLSALLSSRQAFLREHAALALATRLPRLDTVGRLIGLVADGGFTGMLAQRTLEAWASAAPEHVAIGLEGALLGVRDVEARYRLVETLGLVRSRIATRPLLALARDDGEAESVRVAAVSALGQRQGDAGVSALVEGLASIEGHLGDVARLALVDLQASDAVAPRAGSLSVAQLFLHADIDAHLSQAGRGDNGGIATLLVRLGDALDRIPPVDGEAPGRVITMSRGSVVGALESVAEISATTSGHVYGRIPLLADPVQSANAWPLRVAARRGIRRMLRAAGGVDVVHLRMADVGSLAAADVARELDIPVVFTVAPDPQGVIQSLDLSGSLDRYNFGEVDLREHFWFRSRLVQQLASNAAHTVLFPRPELQNDMKQLLGIDITRRPERHTVVPEGIDLAVVDQAVAEAAGHASDVPASGAPATEALDELRALLSTLPASRRGLPLIVSVGRLHRVKGMATIVSAWANGPLRDRANLLIVGGDLARPSADEVEQLDAMNAVVPPADRLARGLLLPGHRPNGTVARWVAAARFGVPDLVAPRGIYVCGSLKEEFGIALLEAMAAGLVVVAPDGGGPATYVDEGDTGFLTRTWDADRLAEAMAAALEASEAETTDERAVRSRATVEQSFTIQAMATALADVYRGVQRDDAQQPGWLASAR